MSGPGSRIIWIFDLRDDKPGPWVTVLKLVDGQYAEQPVLSPDGSVVIIDPSQLPFTLADLTD